MATPLAVTIPAKKPTLTITKTTRATVQPKKVRRKQLTVSKPKRVAIEPTPPAAPKPAAKKTATPSAPKAATVVYRERAGARGATIAAPTTVTVTPQTTVSGQAGNAALSAKIDQLLRESREKKGKTRAKSLFTKAKKEYAHMRKNSLAKLKAENKAIQKRERAKIQKLPADQRAKARQKLKAALKEREAKLKKKFPSKVETPGHLRSLLSSFRVLKI